MRAVKNVYYRILLGRHNLTAFNSNLRLKYIAICQKASAEQKMKKKKKKAPSLSMALSKPSPQKGTEKKKQKDPFSQMSVALGAGLIACTAV